MGGGGDEGKRARVTKVFLCISAMLSKITGCENTQKTKICSTQKKKKRRSNVGRGIFTCAVAGGGLTPSLTKDIQLVGVVPEEGNPAANFSSGSIGMRKKKNTEWGVSG